MSGRKKEHPGFVYGEGIGVGDTLGVNEGVRLTSMVDVKVDVEV